MLITLFNKSHYFVHTNEISMGKCITYCHYTLSKSAYYSITLVAQHNHFMCIWW